ncbi:uncharacterized protein LOC135217617 [Macrobrachium nipponense]|uniref:uncharacterized protein LOC135217617 n=1 Tax=Macrobrachium nipponense TaxID=159736 RepID=UPI0030C83DC8
MSKPKQHEKRLEIELLLDSIQQLETRDFVQTTDALQPLLLAEALMERGLHTSGIFTREMREAAKELKAKEDITVQRADNTAAFVLIKTEKYHEKLDAILSDSSKFERLTQNLTEDIKRDANRVIQYTNKYRNQRVHLPPIQGDFSLGYLYGNVKTHEEGNPLHPIVSQMPAPTYAFAKRLNKILTPYVPSRYSLSSSVEFLEEISDSPGTGIIASLDVESLFTNVPVDETIDIIMDRVYRDPSTAPLNIPEASLRTLLDICTKRAPFSTHRRQMFHQKDGAAMGSPLGVLFANFYMGNVEERVSPRASTPANTPVT